MLSNLRTLPNQLTALRLLAIPAMWVAAALGEPKLVGIGLIVALLTDMIDGPIARVRGETSHFGSRFDSLADQLLQTSAVAWVLMLKPEVIYDNQWPSITALSVYAASLAVGVVRFKRIGNLHLYMSKASGLLLYLFLIHAFVSPGYNRFLLAVALGSFTLSSTETLVLQLILPRVDQHIGSILFLFLGEHHPLRKLARWLP